MSILRSIRKIESAIINTIMASGHRKGVRTHPDSQRLFDEGFPIRVVEHSCVENNIAELHLHEDDLWLCLEGKAEFVLGGKLVNPKDHDGLTFIADSIEDGEIYTLNPGDWLHVPAGQPHQPITEGIARLIIIKIPAIEGRVTLDYIEKTRTKS